MRMCPSLLSFIQIIHVYVFLRAFVYVPVCDAGNCTWVYLWSEHVSVCVYAPFPSLGFDVCSPGV